MPTAHIWDKEKMEQVAKEVGPAPYWSIEIPATSREYLMTAVPQTAEDLCSWIADLCTENLGRVYLYRFENVIVERIELSCTRGEELDCLRTILESVKPGKPTGPEWQQQLQEAFNLALEDEIENAIDTWGL